MEVYGNGNDRRMSKLYETMNLINLHLILKNQ